MKKFPSDIELDSIFFFVEQLKEQRDYSAKFWKGEDTPGDGIETVFGRTPDTDTILGTVDIADDIEQLAEWMRALPGDDE